jgi:DnaJ like chaperone protein
MPTLNETAVILFGLFAGYWVVSKLFFRAPAAKDKPDPVAASTASSVRPIWYETLQVSSAAMAPEIRDAYKHLISKYHPDKVETLGQELRDLAERKSQEITAAYREGMRARGEDP